MLSADTLAQVYSRPERDGPHGGIRWPEMFGCAFKSGRTISLGKIRPRGGSGTAGAKGTTFESLSGPFFAYEYSVAGAYRLFVRDLRSGRVVRNVPSGPSVTRFHFGVDPIVSVVVKSSDGAVAWLVENENVLPVEPGVPNESEFTLFALDKNGERQLAIGKNLDPSSLAIAGSTLYWTQGGTPSSTHLN
ncbi:MAG: hypothetical protein WBV85_12415 [Solirubrobacteraceae bacterium]